MKTLYSESNDSLTLKHYVEYFHISFEKNLVKTFLNLIFAVLYWKHT